MPLIELPIRKKLKILSLGAESVGRFCFYNNGNVFMSNDFGDILDENYFKRYKSAVLKYIRNNKPDIILTDLHPLYNSTILGEKLSKKFKISHIKVQHHLAHIFSAVGDRFLQAENYQLPASFSGIAMDGTGYGFDGNIWGGEVFQIQNEKCKMKSANAKYREPHLNIERIGSLEEQTMIGGDLAVKEPARMLIAVLAKIPNSKLQTCSELSQRIPNKLQITNYKLQTKSKAQNPNFRKEFIYHYVKKFYTRNEFELLYNQLEQGFNCQKTTSTGRILDAVSVLLGFAGNKRNFKHEATKTLENNSTQPYFLEPKIVSPVIARSIARSRATKQSRTFHANNEIASLPVYSELSRRARNDNRTILQTTPLFEYLIENIDQDKMRLAATAQLYFAKGLYEIVKKNIQYPISNIHSVFAAGGMADNKIISEYLTDNNVYISKKIPRGDEGLAFGQIVYYLFMQ